MSVQGRRKLHAVLELVRAHRAPEITTPSTSYGPRLDIVPQRSDFLLNATMDDQARAELHRWPLSECQSIHAPVPPSSGLLSSSGGRQEVM